MNLGQLKAYVIESLEGKDGDKDKGQIKKAVEKLWEKYVKQGLLTSKPWPQCLVLRQSCTL